jgi:hypothetical protein
VRCCGCVESKRTASKRAQRQSFEVAREDTLNSYLARITFHHFASVPPDGLSWAAAMAKGRRAVVSFLLRVLALLGVLIVLRSIGVLPSLHGKASTKYHPETRVKVANAVRRDTDDKGGWVGGWLTRHKQTHRHKHTANTRTCSTRAPRTPSLCSDFASGLTAARVPAAAHDAV